MNLMNGLLNAFAFFTRKLPAHRKLNQLYKHFNWIFLTLGARPIVIAKMKNGTSLRVDLSTRTERIAFYTGEYDADLLETIIYLLKPNSTFLDIGANIGFYSVAMASHIRNENLSGNVLSFEPFEGNFQRLMHNIKLNNLENICDTNNYGLSNVSGVSEITLREDFKHGSNTGNAAIRTGGELDKGFKVSQIKLEKLSDVWARDFKDYNQMDIIKMDIEGHEDFCLEGGKEVIEAQRPTILMEVNKPYYVARNVELDTVFFRAIPSKYTIFKKADKKWEVITSLNQCNTVDNVFLVPNEKLDLKEYSIFGN